MLEKRVLVTGGAGYIGSHTCKALSRAGYTPVSVDNLSSGKRPFVQWGPLEEGDILDSQRLQEVFTKHRPCAVMHFAALIEVEESVYDPLKYYQTNVTGSINLLKLASDFGIRHFVFSSSAAVYGEPNEVPIPEEATLNPINPYGQTKLLFEKVLQDCSEKVASISLRYFNAAGADPELELGDCRPNPTHVIPILLEAAGGKREKFIINGEDYETRDGTCIRDFVHVHDIADAHVRALKLLEEGGTGCFNLSNGYGASLRELVEVTKRVTGKNFPVETGPRRPGDPPQLVGCPKKTHTALGWTPRFPDLEEIVGTAWKWYQKNNGN